MSESIISSSFSLMRSCKRVLNPETRKPYELHGSVEVNILKHLKLDDLFAFLQTRNRAPEATHFKTMSESSKTQTKLQYTNCYRGAHPYCTVSGHQIYSSSCLKWSTTPSSTPQFTIYGNLQSKGSNKGCKHVLTFDEL